MERAAIILDLHLSSESWKTSTRKHLMTQNKENTRYFAKSWVLCDKLVQLITILWTNREKPINCNYLFCQGSTINCERSAIILSKVLCSVYQILCTVYQNWQVWGMQRTNWKRASTYPFLIHSLFIILLWIWICHILNTVKGNAFHSKFNPREAFRWLLVIWRSLRLFLSWLL